jgi:hypothetical protein
VNLYRADPGGGDAPQAGEQPSGVLLISGVPGAGKTMVARLVAAAFARTALIHGDEVHNLVVAGRRHPNEEPADEAESQLRLRDRNIAALADNLVPNASWSSSTTSSSTSRAWTGSARCSPAARYTWQTSRRTAKRPAAATRRGPRRASSRSGSTSTV